jgi:hypothetical protein
VNEEVLASKGLTFLVSRRAALDLLSLPLPSLPSFLLTSSTQLHHSSPLSVLLYLLQLFLSLQTVIHHRIVQSQILNCKYSAVGSMFIPSIHSFQPQHRTLTFLLVLLVATYNSKVPPTTSTTPSFVLGDPSLPCCFYYNCCLCCCCLLYISSLPSKHKHPRSSSQLAIIIVLYRILFLYLPLLLPDNENLICRVSLVFFLVCCCFINPCSNIPRRVANSVLRLRQEKSLTFSSPIRRDLWCISNTTPQRLSGPPPQHASINERFERAFTGTYTVGDIRSRYAVAGA